MFLAGGLINAATTRDPHDDFWYGPAGTMTAAGMPISEESAMKISAVFACVRILSETIASLPVFLYRRDEDGSKIQQDSHPLWEVLKFIPNPWQTSMQYREQRMVHLALGGNGYALKQPGRRGAIDSLVPLLPANVRPVVENNRIIYEVTDSVKGTVTRYGSDRIHHIAGLSWDGIVGLSPIALTRQSMGLAAAGEEYAARFFANDATPRGVLQHPGHFESKEAFDRFRTTWHEAQTGANRHKTAVLEGGMEYKDIGTTNRDAQFIESRKFQLTDIARIFRVPPHMIGDLERATFSNIEHQAIEFVVHTIRPWLVRWEQAVKRDLIGFDDPTEVEFVVEGLLRGDTKSRYEAYSKSINDGWQTPNEVRELENMNPLPGLDKPRQQLNTTQVGGEDPEQDPQEEPSEEEEANASRVVDIELSHLKKAHAEKGPGGFVAAAREFYKRFPDKVRAETGLDPLTARMYCDSSYHELQHAEDPSSILSAWESSKAATLGKHVRLLK